jgi:hypothetical protein
MKGCISVALKSVGGFPLRRPHREGKTGDVGKYRNQQFSIVGIFATIASHVG